MFLEKRSFHPVLEEISSLVGNSLSWSKPEEQESEIILLRRHRQ